MFVQMHLKGSEKAGKERGQEGFWVAVVQEELSVLLIFYFYSLMMEAKHFFINPEAFSFIWKTDTNYDFSFILY